MTTQLLGDDPAPDGRGDGGVADFDTIGPYRVLQQLGQGGMGIVHLALDAPGPRSGDQGPALPRGPRRGRASTAGSRGRHPGAGALPADRPRLRRRPRDRAALHRHPLRPRTQPRAARPGGRPPRCAEPAHPRAWPDRGPARHPRRRRHPPRPQARQRPHARRRPGRHRLRHRPRRRHLADDDDRSRDGHSRLPLARAGRGRRRHPCHGLVGLGGDPRLRRHRPLSLRPWGMEAVPARVCRGDADLRDVDPQLAPLLHAALAPDPTRRPDADEVLMALEAWAHGRPVTEVLPQRTRVLRPRRDAGIAAGRCAGRRAARPVGAGRLDRPGSGSDPRISRAGTGRAWARAVARDAARSAARRPGGARPPGRAARPPG
uniref:Uncharacterized protein n=1 Tax=Janibacter limosus TaxID=53458 RepID=A0AC61U521_9MICO|nr:hypothetical protein [Janibacter limosus]